MPVAHRSASNCSGSVISGNGGSLVSDSGASSSWPGRDNAAAPAVHSDSRRLVPKPVNAPAVARASS